jgi:hypothetical protein
MNIIEDRDIQAFIDGELAPDEAARIRAAIADDVLVAARVERERRLRASIRGAFDPVLHEAVPDRLQALLRASVPDDLETSAPTRGVDAPTVIALRRPEPKLRGWRAPAYALAASLAVLAVSMWLRPDRGDLQMQPAGLLAGGELERALDRSLASVGEADGSVAIGLTFRDSDGRICRSFARRSAPSLAGLACREGGQWQLAMLSDAGAAGEGDVRQAAAAIPPELQAAIDERLAGEVFDAQQERAAREAGWE